MDAAYPNGTLDRPWPRILPVALGVAAVGLVLHRYVSVMSWSWPITIDDAFISFRYARNFADGYGLRWNPGEQPVEGYTNFLWVVLLAVAEKLKVDQLGFAKAIGLACSIAGLGAIAHLAWRTARSYWAALAAFLILGCSNDYIVDATLGLETPLFLLLMALAANDVVALSEEPTPDRAIRAGLLLGLSALTRAEGLVLFVLAAAWLGYRWRSEFPRRAAVALVVSFSVFAVPHILFRLLYYGDYLPNSVRAKALDAWDGRVQAFLDQHPSNKGTAYVSDFLLTFAPCLFLSAATLATASRATLDRLTFLVLVASVYIAGMAGTWPIMGVGHRLLLPAASLLAVAAAPGCVEAAKRITTPIGALLVVSVALMGLRFLEEEELPAQAETQHGAYRPMLENYWNQIEQEHLRLARRLTHYPPITIAITDCGVIPYYSQLKTIDLFGLNDREIAQHGVTAADILRRQPELVILAGSTQRKGEGWFDWEQPLWRDPGFNERYVPDFTEPAPPGAHYNLVVFRRRDFSRPEQDLPP